MDLFTSALGQRDHQIWRPKHREQPVARLVAGWTVLTWMWRCQLESHHPKQNLKLAMVPGLQVSPWWFQQGAHNLKCLLTSWDSAVARLLTAQCGLWPQGLEKVAAGLHQPQPGSAAVGAAVSLPITARSKLRGQTSRRKLHPLCPFAPVESFMVAKVSIGKRRRCGRGTRHIHQVVK